MSNNNPNNSRKNIKRPGMDAVVTAFFGMIILLPIFSVLNSNFLSASNLSQLLRSICPYLLIGIGQGIVCLTGNIDLSIGSVVGMSAMISSTLICNGMNPVSAILIDLICCLAAGVFNGVLIGKYKISSFIGTLGSMTICRGIAQLVNGGYNSDSIDKYSGSELFRNIFYYGKIGPVYYVVIITAIIFIIINHFVNRTGTGLHIYAIGSNKETAKLSGISIFKTITVIYMISALCSGIAGLISLAGTGMGSISSGISYEMYAVAAAVIGGISTMGGYGLLLGVIPGAAIWTILQNGLTLANVPIAMRNIIIGIIVVICVLLDVDSRSNGKPKKKKISPKLKSILGIGISVICILICVIIGIKNNISSSGTNNSVSDAPIVKVAVVTMDQTNEHWLELYNAAVDTAEKYNSEGMNLKVTWFAPEYSDVQKQVEQINAAISDNSDYIIIACTEANSVVRPLTEAKKSGAKIIFVDSAANTDALATFSTDNFESGFLAGEYLKKALYDSGITNGTIGIIDVSAGMESTSRRCDGFGKALEGTDFTLSERMYAEQDVSKAQDTANSLINNGAVALYATSTVNTTGAAAAVKEASQSGHNVIVVGWDKSDATLKFLEDGYVKCLVVQNPRIMGTYAIDAVVSLEKGDMLDPAPVDTGVILLTKENLEKYLEENQ